MNTDDYILWHDPRYYSQVVTFDRETGEITTEEVAGRFTTLFTFDPNEAPCQTIANGTVTLDSVTAFYRDLRKRLLYTVDPAD